MEFEKRDSVNVSVIGFGCPALLSCDLSESVRDMVTTVVGDADIIPRTSAATITNFLLDIAEHDWTLGARRDVKQALKELQRNAPSLIKPEDVDQVVDFVDTMLEKNSRKGIRKVTTERDKALLFPPGKCVHFYREFLAVCAESL